MLNWINTKTYEQHTHTQAYYTQIIKNKNKDEILMSAREKNNITDRGTKIRVKADLS